MNAGHEKSGTTAAMKAIPIRDAIVRLHSRDQVALARMDLPGGAILVASGAAGMPDRLMLREPIASGHKLALRAIAAGEPVLRYGQVIGFASQAIAAGEHVHTQNLGTQCPADYIADRGVADDGDAAPVCLTPVAERRTFLGYARADGRVGTRNYIAVIATVNCAAHAARTIARHFTPERLAATPNVDGVIALTHRSGCGIRPDGPGYVWLQRVLAGMARHPNVAGYVLVGLGCEVNQIAALAANYGLDAGAGMVIQELGGTRKTVEAGIARVQALLPAADAVGRTPQPVAELRLALQCGGSDSWSGITANPVVGLVADEVVRQGGGVVLAETPEIYGAEHLLTRRAASPEIARKLLDQVRWWEAHTRRQGTEIDNNPAPGNKAGGLTTIYEKALGAVAKSGHMPLMDVVGYAERVTARGVTFMDTPGNDPISVTGQVAGGCNLVLFTTGRGTVFGFKPAPCVKIVSNSATYQRMVDDMDFNAGRVLEGAALEDVAAELLDLAIEIASGRPSKSEAQGIGEDELSPWDYGDTV